MKTGRYTYNVVLRSIKRPIERCLGGLAEGFRENYDCAVLREENEFEGGMKQGKEIAVGAACCELYEFNKEVFLQIAFYRACSQLYANRCIPQLVSASFIWPDTAEESSMAKAVEILAGLCKNEGCMLGTVNAEASRAVSRGIVNIHVVGLRPAGKAKPGAQETIMESFRPVPGCSLIMCGHVGMAGIGILASMHDGKLEGRYTPGFIAQAQEFSAKTGGRDVYEALKGIEACVYPVQEGGVLAALWNFADGAGTGIDVDMKKLPIRQETVEISEFYGINPYQLLADGACFIATFAAEMVCEALARKGIDGKIIGHVTSDHARILRRDDEVRYIDKPAQDELIRLLEEKFARVPV